MRGVVGPNAKRKVVVVMKRYHRNVHTCSSVAYILYAVGGKNESDIRDSFLIEKEYPSFEEKGFPI